MFMGRLRHLSRRSIQLSSSKAKSIRGSLLAVPGRSSVEKA